MHAVPVAVPVPAAWQEGGLRRDVIGRRHDGARSRDGGAGSGVARDADGTAIARGSGDEAGAALGVAAALAGSLRTAPGTTPGPPAAPWPGVSSANATAAPMSTSAVAEAVRAAWKLVSSSQELIASRSRARPARRA